MSYNIFFDMKLNSNTSHILVEGSMLILHSVLQVANILPNQHEYLKYSYQTATK